MEIFMGESKSVRIFKILIQTNYLEFPDNLIINTIQLSNEQYYNLKIP